MQKIPEARRRSRRKKGPGQCLATLQLLGPDPGELALELALSRRRLLPRHVLEAAPPGGEPAGKHPVSLGDQGVKGAEKLPNLVHDMLIGIDDVGAGSCSAKRVRHLGQPPLHL